MNNISTSQSFFKGGGSKYCMGKRRGGHGGNDNPPSFCGLPIRYYYGQNDYMQDPQDPSVQIASRQLPNMVGGKNKTKKVKRGGSLLGFSSFSDSYNTSQSYNPINTIGNVSNSTIASKILSGNVNTTVLPNPTILDQPVNAKYHQNNMPKA